MYISPHHSHPMDGKNNQQMMLNVFVLDQAAQVFIYLIIHVCVGNYGSRCSKTYIESIKNPWFHTFFKILDISLEIPSISHSICEKPSISKFLIRNISCFDRSQRFLIEIIGISIKILGYSFEILGISKICDSRIP